jgi:hypothetical protein
MTIMRQLVSSYTKEKLQIQLVIVIRGPVIVICRLVIVIFGLVIIICGLVIVIFG